jgi:hypothetical protein
VEDVGKWWRAVFNIGALSEGSWWNPSFLMSKVSRKFIHCVILFDCRACWFILSALQLHY